MLFDKKVRDAYWVLTHLSRAEGYVTDQSLKEVMYKTRSFLITNICNPLVAAGILEKKYGCGYKLTRAPQDILLVDVHKAFNPKWYQEMSSIQLFIDQCLGEKTVEDLRQYEEQEMKDILQKLVL